jgi:hypothetical protein
MDFSSLRRYPTFPKGRPGWRIALTAGGSSPRTTRVLFDLAVLTCLAAAFYGVWWTARRIEQPPPPPPPKPAPLDFNVIAARHDEVKHSASRDDVERLLGPPTEPLPPGAQFDGLEEVTERAAHSHRGFDMPEPQLWRMWVDPQDEGRWVAIYFAGGKVYGKTKRGF